MPFAGGATTLHRTNITGASTCPLGAGQKGFASIEYVAMARTQYSPSKEIVFGGTSTLFHDPFNTAERYEYAHAMRQATLMFVEWVTRRGGICVNSQYYHVRFIFVDDEARSDNAGAAAEILISDLNAQFIFGR